MTSPTPTNDALYAHLAKVLRGRIARLQPGEKISSEPSLAREFNVSRFTVSRAIEQLVRDGLVVRRQGSGTYVADQVLRQMPGRLQGFAEAVTAAGQHSSQRLRSFGQIDWSPDFPYSAGTELHLLDRFRLVNGRKMALHRSILAGDIIRETGLTEAVVSQPDFSLYRHLERHGHRAESAQESFVARLGTEEEIELLELPNPAAVIAVRRTTRDADGAIIDFVEALYDARSYSYRAELARGAQIKQTKISAGVQDEHVFVTRG